MKRKTEIITNLTLVLVVITVITVTFFGSVSNVFSTSDQPIYKGNTDNKCVSLMVNVYWGTEYIEPMLAIFDKYDVKTTFFVGGTWVAKNPDVLSKIYESGHEIGNHGFYHKNQDKLNYQQNYAEIETTHKVVEELIGCSMNLFAPPSGAYSTNTLNSAKALGYKTIMWSKDTIDWRDKDSTTTFNRATKNLSNGDLILMHPTAHTLKALDNILKFYQENNFKAVTVTENIK